MNPETDAVYVARREDGTTVVYNKRGVVVMSFPSDAPTEPAHIDDEADGTRFFVGTFIAICLSLVALSLTYVCAQCITAWLR